MAPDPRPPAPEPAEVAATFGEVADPLLAELASTALQAARAAAAVLVRGAAVGARDVETKISGTDMVSEVDRGSEAAVAAVLRERRPDDGLLGEEGTVNAGTTGVRWVVDPLDGTTNFIFGIPQWSVSIAAEVDGAGAVGVVVHPGRDEVWAAVRTGVARRNGTPVQVAEGRSELATALVATGFGYRSERRAWQASLLPTVLPAVRDLRRLGSAALDLCWVAGGRFDAYFEWGLNPWDLAAGALICERAGGRVGTIGDRMVVAAPPGLYDPLVELLVAAGGATAPAGPEPAEWG